MLSTVLVGEVEEKDVALVAVLAVMPLQVAGKPVERERDSLVLRARAVVIDERRLEARVDGLNLKLIGAFAFTGKLRDAFNPT